LSATELAAPINDRSICGAGSGLHPIAYFCTMISYP
jgi:hypothetical protein